MRKATDLDYILGDRPWESRYLDLVNKLGGFIEWRLQLPRLATWYTHATGPLHNWLCAREARKTAKSLGLLR